MLAGAWECGPLSFPCSLTLRALWHPLVSACRRASPGCWVKEVWEEWLEKGEGGEMRLGAGARAGSEFPRTEVQGPSLLTW